MVETWEPIDQHHAARRLDPEAVLNALPQPVFVVDPDDRLVFVNQASEQFFETGAAGLLGRALRDFLPGDSPLFGLIQRARDGEQSLFQAGLTIETPRIGSHSVSIVAAPMADAATSVVVSLQERSMVRKLDHRLMHRSAARSVSAMAAMLAHEVKNPLSGIRGAAQLLEENSTPGDRELTRLICDEADRIVDLVDRMEMFADQRPIERAAVNIHEVLGHVRRIAQAGFAKDIAIVETYDPSLPAVLGNRDLLIQTLLNLVKNAAEAVDPDDGQIVLSTRYQQGLRLALPGSDSRVELPLAVMVEDNGAGIAEDLRPHLFEPFVTGKLGGKGLGLSLVAKIIGDHGGIIEFESEPKRTVFRLMLPQVPAPSSPRPERQDEGAGS